MSDHNIDDDYTDYNGDDVKDIDSNEKDDDDIVTS